MADQTGWLLTMVAKVAHWMPGWAKQGLYRTGPLARGIRRGLNRAAPDEMTVINIASGALAGMPMLLDLQQEKDYWLGTYEPDLQSAINALVKPGWVAYDVGANIGYVTLILRRAVGDQGKVFAFEALPANLERLTRNVALNYYENQVEVIAGAVVEASRTVRFLVGPSDDMGKAEGSAGRVNRPGSESITVQGISLDDFVYSGLHPAPQVLKLDIEGGEVLALPGMRRLLTEARPLLLLELHGEQAAGVVWNELQQIGYTIYSMQPGYPRINSLVELDWKAYLVAKP